MTIQSDERTGVGAQSRQGGRGSAGYNLLYRIGATPWDQNNVPSGLKELVEGSHALVPGRALDLGCGGGRLSIYLAERGWEVTGIDYLARPLEIARSRASEAAIEVRWLQGDVTHVNEIDLGDRYDLLLDAGCFHGLGASEREGYVNGVNAASASLAHMLLLCFKPAFRGPAPRGLDHEAIVAAFQPQWELLWGRPAADIHLPRMLRSASPTWYCLRRTLRDVRADAP